MSQPEEGTMAEKTEGDRFGITPTPEKPFRVEIIGHGHPHRGARGMCEPEKRALAGGSLIRVALDEPSATGADACYASRSELKVLTDAR